MISTPRPPTHATLALYRLIIVIRLTLATAGTAIAQRWRLARRSGDAGVETVEIAIGLALGLALALVVWAAYKAITAKYLPQAT